MYGLANSRQNVKHQIIAIFDMNHFLYVQQKNTHHCFSVDPWIICLCTNPFTKQAGLAVQWQQRDDNRARNTCDKILFSDRKADGS